MTNVEISGGSSLQGGGIYVSDRGEVYISDSLIHGSGATDGGGVYLENTCTLNLDRVSFTENAAELRGGAIYYGDGTHINSVHATFTANRANYGSGVYIQEGSSCSKYHFNDTLFTQNVAAISGSVYFSASNESCSEAFGDMTSYVDNQALYGADLASSMPVILA